MGSSPFGVLASAACPGFLLALGPPATCLSFLVAPRDPCRPPRAASPSAAVECAYCSFCPVLLTRTRFFLNGTAVLLMVRFLALGVAAVLAARMALGGKADPFGGGDRGGWAWAPACGPPLVSDPLASWIFGVKTDFSDRCL